MVNLKITIQITVPDEYEDNLIETIENDCWNLEKRIDEVCVKNACCSRN